jgi:hypothetical protein
VANTRPLIPPEYYPPYYIDGGQVLVTPHIIGSRQTGKAVVVAGADLHSEDFVSNTSGWQIDGDGNAEFNSGTFRGQLIAGSIDIPDTTTANSFHVQADGDTFWGATTIGAAPAVVNKDGSAAFTDLDLSGDLIMQSGGVMKTAPSGQRVELANAAWSIYSSDHYGMNLETGLGGQVLAGFVGILDASYLMRLVPPHNGGTDLRTYIELDATDADPSIDIRARQAAGGAATMDLSPLTVGSGGGITATHAPFHASNAMDALVDLAALSDNDGDATALLRADTDGTGDAVVEMRSTAGGGGAALLKFTGTCDWQTWSTVVDQGASTNIAKTVAYAKYLQIGNLVFASCELAFTGTGSAGSEINLSLPVTAADIDGLNGTFHYFDLNTTTRYWGPAFGNTVDELQFAIAQASASTFGVTPAVTIASGDTLRVEIMYEAA